MRTGEAGENGTDPGNKEDVPDERGGDSCAAILVALGGGEGEEAVVRVLEPLHDALADVLVVRRRLDFARNIDMKFFRAVVGGESTRVAIKQGVIPAPYVAERASMRAATQNHTHLTRTHEHFIGHTARTRGRTAHALSHAHTSSHSLWTMYLPDIASTPCCRKLQLQRNSRAPSDVERMNETFRGAENYTHINAACGYLTR